MKILLVAEKISFYCIDLSASLIPANDAKYSFVVNHAYYPLYFTFILHITVCRPGGEIFHMKNLDS